MFDTKGRWYAYGIRIRVPPKPGRPARAYARLATFLNANGILPTHFQKMRQYDGEDFVHIDVLVFSDSRADPGDFEKTEGIELYLLSES